MSVVPADDAAASAADRGLVARLAAGDEHAMGELYDRHATSVFTLGLRIVGDRWDAEEVVQETFTQAWRQASRYDPRRATVAGWLLMIARSRAIDRLRARGAKPDGRPVGLVVDVPSPGPGQDALALDREAARRVREALDALGDTLRAPLELAYFEDLSQSAIAERLNQPLGTIKTRMRTALSRLRHALRAEA